jgi:hypothetical protein
LGKRWEGLSSVRRIIVAILSGVVVTGCGGAASATPSGTATSGPANSAAPSANLTSASAPTAYSSPLGVPAQVLLNAFAEMGFEQQGGVTDTNGEATYSLSDPATAGAVIVAGDPVVLISMSGPMDLAPAAQMLLTRFATPDALAWFNEQVPTLADGYATKVSKVTATLLLSLQPNRYKSKNGFVLMVTR